MRARGDDRLLEQSTPTKFDREEWEAIGHPPIRRRYLSFFDPTLGSEIMKKRRASSRPLTN
jgi:hypothetical protein